MRAMSTESQSSHPTIGRTALIALGTAMLLMQPLVAQEETYELSPEDTWKPTKELDPDGQQARLLRARRAILDGDPQRGEDIATAFIDQYPNSPFLPDAYLIRGDALLADDNEYEALFDYEEIARNHPNSAVFVTARIIELMKKILHQLKMEGLLPPHPGISCVCRRGLCPSSPPKSRPL